MKIALRNLLACLLLIASDCAGEDPAWVEAQYAPSTDLIANPERGLYVELGDRRQRPLDDDRLRELGDDQITLIQRLYYLKGYRDRPLDAVQLDLIERDFQTVRSAGMKVILRFAYSSRIGEPDAPLAVVMGHIEQLTPLLRENADLILTMQAGFIGAWGEWHASTNGLAQPGPMRRIATALLEALPPDRTVQVRTPRQKQRLLDTSEPLSEATLVRGSLAARIGHHNDCFLADGSDVGTYREPALDEERSYVAQDSRFVPVGGETCRNGERSDADFAREEMARMHWSFLNLAYHRGVIKKWRQTGFLDEVRLRLGCRVRLTRARFGREAEAGGRLVGEIEIANDGWAAPINPRPVFLLLAPVGGGEPLRIDLADDPRDWMPGAAHTLAVDAAIPADAAPGEYRVRLHLPDASDRLAADPRYSLRMANDGVWSADGANDLGLRVELRAHE